MSNRSLLEINHDFWYRIEDDKEEFVQAPLSYTSSASPENALKLERFGIRVFGMRHHSEGFRIEWGHHKASEK